MSRHSWQKVGRSKVCRTCSLEMSRGMWGPRFVRNGKVVQGEQAADRILPDGRSVAVFRTPSCLQVKGGQDR